jgi:hypothetical protein
MNGFKKMLLYGSIIILLIILVIIGIALSYAKDETWPPMVPSCPDWWIIAGTGNNATCVDVKDLIDTSKCPNSTKSKHYRKNFNEAVYSGSQGTCNKYRWATQCGVEWDGITYGVNNPCDETA